MHPGTIGGIIRLFQKFNQQINCQGDLEEKEYKSISAGGQHEEHTEYGSPVRDVVNKNNAEPQAAHLEGFWVKMWLILLIFSVFCRKLGDFTTERLEKYIRTTRLPPIWLDGYYCE